MRSPDRSFPGFPPYIQETRNEGVNETGNEAGTKLVLLCKIGNEGNLGEGQKHGNEEAFFTPPRFHVSIRFQRPTAP
jgi:hypothetical protein